MCYRVLLICLLRNKKLNNFFLQQKQSKGDDLSSVQLAISAVEKKRALINKNNTEKTEKTDTEKNPNDNSNSCSDNDESVIFNI